MNVSVEKKLGNGNTELVTQKMVTFALYSKLRSTELEQRQAIAILTQKVRKLQIFKRNDFIPPPIRLSTWTIC